MAASQCPPITPNLPPLPLPEGITSSYIRTPALTYHILSSGAPTPTNPTKKPLILLLHGFPELAYSWRKIMPQLANLAPTDPADYPPGSSPYGEDDPLEFEPSSKDGYHVVAYDQRGYGRTTGWDTRPYHEVDLNTFRMTEVVKDAVRLVFALGYTECACIIGHDFGAVGAALSALIRPDIFKKVLLMSHPFTGIPPFPLGTATHGVAAGTENNEIKKCLDDLAKLPQPRKHYKYYYSTPFAAPSMHHPPQGLRAFLLAYFHLKSGPGCSPNDTQPHDLGAHWDANEIAKMPGYYIMPLSSTMPETIASDLAAQHLDAVSLALPFMSEQELAVYVDEYSRTGFQGGLNYYRISTSSFLQSDLEIYAAKKIEVPVAFVCGDKDWGEFQTPGAVARMRDRDVCPLFRGGEGGGTWRIGGVGHWSMQEWPGEVVRRVHAHLENRGGA